MRSFTGGIAIVLVAAATALLGPPIGNRSLADATNAVPNDPALTTPSPLEKLDRERLTPIERSFLPAETVAVVPGESGAVASCAFSPDGKLATACERNAIELWDLTGAAPKKIATL